MVDFNNETTIGVPAHDIMRVLILQRRNDLLEAIEAYNKKEDEGVDMSLSIIKARLSTLFLELRPMLARKLKPQEFKELQSSMQQDTIQAVINSYNIINNALDAITLTRIDTRILVDTKHTSYEDEEKGL